jgi:gluconate:H+ symporter, GntP family
MHLLAQILGMDAAVAGPLFVLGISVLFIIFTIVVLRLHAFLALILAAFLTGALANLLPGGPPQPGQPIEIAVSNFGTAAGQVAIVIAFASIIGMCLMESGAADKIVRCFIRFFGEKRAGLAMLVSGFFLSIPVFFDTVFFLLIPLARALSIRSGKNYILFIMAMAGGGAITHSIVPPTPGPLLVSATLNIDLGIALVGGLIAGILPAVGVYYMAKFFNWKLPIPVRETSGASIEDINAILAKKDEELPSFAVSIMPVLLPALLIAVASFLTLINVRLEAAQNAGAELPRLVEALGGPEPFASLLAAANFIGNKNFALLIGAVIALAIYIKQTGLRLANEKLGPTFESAGVIILITSAGGAFGAMIRYAGVGESINALAEGREINFILLAWMVTAVIRIAQGSATVAMITASALMATVVDANTLPYHPVYIYLAIGFGSIILSWMNDSGFWVVCKLSGMTERETLKTWTVLLTGISIIGLIEILLLAPIIPLK